MVIHTSIKVISLIVNTLVLGPPSTSGLSSNEPTPCVIMISNDIMSPSGNTDGVIERQNRWYPIHPDIGKAVPIWSMISTSSKHFSLIRRLMGGPLIQRNPIIRMYSNLTDMDKDKYPSYTGQFNIIIDNEIWLTDNSTIDDLIYMIILYYQINLRNMSDSMISSSAAKGERKFFWEQWNRVMNNSPVNNNPRQGIIP